MENGIYIHIPFCRKKCEYCSFYSVPVGGGEAGEAAVRAYVDRLLREMDERRAECEGACADTLYLGGGTPSMLRPADVDRLIRTACTSIGLSPGAEITMEINSDDAYPGLLESYRNAGVNRMVLGVQALRAQTHAAIGRAARLCDDTRLDVFFGLGRVTHCADMIIGVPGERTADLESDLSSLTGYGPEHLSVYVLSVDDGTPLSCRVVRDADLEGQQAEAFKAAKSFLEGRGYFHYEISNYARPGGESRHNMKYWRYQPYIGLGAGAHSFIGGERRYNAMGVDEYCSSRTTVLVEDRRGPMAPLTEYIMTGMRLLSGMNIEEMEHRLGVAVPRSVKLAIEAQETAGMLVQEMRSGERLIRLSREGILFADRVIYALVETLL